MAMHNDQKEVVSTRKDKAFASVMTEYKNFAFSGYCSIIALDIF